MMLFIEDSGCSPSCAFLKWICKEFGSDTREIQVANPKDFTITPEVFAITEDHNLEYYKWLLANFSSFLHTEHYVSLYGFALVKHIIATETRCDVKQLCQTTQVSEDAINKNVVRYAKWLSTLGRDCDLDANVLISLISHLDSSDGNTEVVIKGLLYSIAMRPSTSRTICLQELFTFVTTQPKDPERILKLMGQTGLLEIVEWRRCVLEGESQNIRLPKTAWSYSGPIDSEDKATRDLVELTQLQYLYSQISLSQQIYDRLLVIDQESPGIIVKFFPAILRRYIGNLAEYGHLYNHRLVSYLLVDGIITTPMFISKLYLPGKYTVSLMAEITNIILSHGNETVIASYDSKIRELSDGNDIYTNTVNRTLRSLMSVSGRSLQVVNIIETLGSIINLDDTLPLTYADNRVFEALLVEIDRREDRNLACLADTVLACSLVFQAHTNEAVHKFPAKWTKFVGRGTCRLLITTSWQWEVSDSLNYKLEEYADDNLQPVIEGLINSYLARRLEDTYYLCDELEDLAYGYRGYLIIGSNVYQPTGDGLTLRRASYDDRSNIDVLVLTHCDECHVLLSECIIFRSPQASHGKFLCEDCRDKECDQPVMCIVCLSDEEGTDMRILPCQHTSCISCIGRLESPRECPLCKCEIPIIKMQVSTHEITNAEAIRVFCEELESSPREKLFQLVEELRKKTNDFPPLNLHEDEESSTTTTTEDDS